MRGCVVLDVRMDGMSGLELFDQLTPRQCRLPVIFLTGHGDVPMAVAALKKGALDFVEKPFNDNELVDAIAAALAARRRRSGDRRAAARASPCASPRCRRANGEVMDLILAGDSNKTIADDLGIAMRTVEVHRARILEKMAVRSAVELAQLLATKR